MTRMMTFLIAAVLTTGPVQAKPGLRDVPELDQGLFVIALANEIRRKCDDISPRWLRANSYVNDLQDKALSLGYTRAEVKAHLDDDAEKDRMRGLAARYMTDKGVANGDFCGLGRIEIAAGTDIGRLLRER
ncbi:MAG: DUF5333 domain-containing protein [Rhodobacteraceae bacterium]|nr:DUF5333 domain-containing protein [Paracoccaceae bacterium]